LLLVPDPSPFEFAWMKVKLGGAAVVFLLHGFVRAQVRKVGDGAVFPPWVVPALLAAGFVIVYAVVFRPPA
jgi:hypothetical protein